MNGKLLLLLPVFVDETALQKRCYACCVELNEWDKGLISRSSEKNVVRTSLARSDARDCCTSRDSTFIKRCS
jgi:hypothetical protein